MHSRPAGIPCVAPSTPLKTIRSSATELAERFGLEPPRRTERTEGVGEAWEEDADEEGDDEGEEEGEEEAQHTRQEASPDALREAVAQGAGPVRRTSRRVPKPIDYFGF